jgi:hypothetical protein
MSVLIAALEAAHRTGGEARMFGGVAPTLRGASHSNCQRRMGQSLFEAVNQFLEKK